MANVGQQFIIKVFDEFDDGSQIIAQLQEQFIDLASLNTVLKVPIFPARKQPSYNRNEKDKANLLAPISSGSKKSSPNRPEDSLTVSTRVSIQQSSTNSLLQTQPQRSNYIVNSYLSTVKKHLNLPTRAEVEGQIIRSLIQQKGKLLYMIHMEWTSSYTDFLQHKTTQIPGPINNSDLFADQSQLNTYRLNLIQDVDFVLLNLNTWTFISQVYGGGPEVKYNDYLKEMHGVDDLRSETESGAPNISLTFSRLSSMQSFRNDTAQSIQYDNGTFELPPVGFHNDGNLCFMHAGLQSLLTIEQMNCWFQTEGKAMVQRDLKKYPWIYAYFELVLAISTKKQGANLKIQGLRNMIKDYFNPKEQHDCQEFIRFLLDKLHEEMKIDDQYYQPITDILFQGQMLSQLTCQNCKNVSSRFENFLDLSVSMHRMYKLYDSLTDFFAQESISDNYSCESCERKSSAVKRFVIGSAPSYLMIHVKRFMVYPVRAKLHGHLEFPLELNIQKYCSTEIETKYRLKSVIVHYGTPERGHYVSFAQRMENVSKTVMQVKIYQVHEKDVLSQQAYVLFYQKRDDLLFQ